MTKLFNSDDEIHSLVHSFENCTINPAEFKHYQHLAVALWYLTTYTHEDATEKMRAGIQRLAAAYGKSGYHETITLFWLAIVREFVARAQYNNSIADLANALATEYADKNFIHKFYSAQLLASEDAKQGWIAPDLRALVETAGA